MAEEKEGRRRRIRMGRRRRGRRIFNVGGVLVRNNTPAALTPGSCRLMAATDSVARLMISSPSPANSKRGSARMI